MEIAELFREAHAILKDIPATRKFRVIMKYPHCAARILRDYTTMLQVGYDDEVKKLNTIHDKVMFLLKSVPPDKIKEPTPKKLAKYATKILLKNGIKITLTIDSTLKKQLDNFTHYIHHDKHKYCQIISYL